MEDIDISEFLNSGELDENKLLLIVKMAKDVGYKEGYNAGYQYGFNKGALETLQQIDTLANIDDDI